MFVNEHVIVRQTAFVVLHHNKRPDARAAFLTDTLEVARDLRADRPHPFRELLTERKPIKIHALLRKADARF